MPGLCQICGRACCDHTAEERGLTPEEWEREMSRGFTPEEERAFGSGDPKVGITAGRRAAARLYGKIYSLPDGDVVGL